MYHIKDHGGEKPSNNFASIAFNPKDNTYHIIWNTRFRTPSNKAYRISNSYDFGALDIKDLLVDAYNNPSLLTVGFSLIK